MQKREETSLFCSFPALDGVRAISILWVVLFHPPIEMPAWLMPVRMRGVLGVELFFAISGFLVTRSLFQCVSKTESKLKTVKDFLMRRVSRIFPPYFLVLVVILMIGFFIDSSLWGKLQSIKDTLWAYFFFVSNYVIPGTHGTIPDTLVVTWSLAFEEQFYLYLLLMFLLLGTRWLYLGIIATGIFSVGMRFYSTFGVSPILMKDWQLFLHLRFDALAWACLSWIFFDELGWLWAHRLRARIVNAVIVLGMSFCIVEHHYYAGEVGGAGSLDNSAWEAIIYALMAPFFSLAVRALCEIRYQKSYFVKTLSHPVCAFIGVVSYEIYLIHELIIGLLVRLRLQSQPLLFGILTYALSIGGAWIFHRFFSMPTQKWLRRWA